jgi:hypothetical protein
MSTAAAEKSTAGSAFATAAAAVSGFPFSSIC